MHFVNRTVLPLLAATCMLSVSAVGTMISGSLGA
jgi:hypothetical protein